MILAVVFSSNLPNLRLLHYLFVLLCDFRRHEPWDLANDALQLSALPKYLSISLLHIVLDHSSMALSRLRHSSFLQQVVSACSFHIILFAPPSAAKKLLY